MSRVASVSLFLGLSLHQPRGSLCSTLSAVSATRRRGGGAAEPPLLEQSQVQPPDKSRTPWAHGPSCSPGLCTASVRGQAGSVHPQPPPHPHPTWVPQGPDHTPDLAVPGPSWPRDQKGTVPPTPALPIVPTANGLLSGAASPPTRGWFHHDGSLVTRISFPGDNRALRAVLSLRFMQHLLSAGHRPSRGRPESLAPGIPSCPFGATPTHTSSGSFHMCVTSSPSPSSSLCSSWDSSGGPADGPPARSGSGRTGSSFQACTAQKAEPRPHEGQRQVGPHGSSMPGPDTWHPVPLILCIGRSGLHPGWSVPRAGMAKDGCGHGLPFPRGAGPVTGPLARLLPQPSSPRVISPRRPPASAPLRPHWAGGGLVGPSGSVLTPPVTPVPREPQPGPARVLPVPLPAPAQLRSPRLETFMQKYMP